MTLRLSAYVPCYNRADTIRAAVESLLAQTVPPGEVLVIDDGSTDGSAGRLAGLPVRILRNDTNLGRGAARARALREAAGEFVLSVDATFVLPPNFAEALLPWFEDGNVAGVCGRIDQAPPRTTADRWRARHLYRLNSPLAQTVRRKMVFQPFGAIVRRAHVLDVGNFDATLRHAEDAELGARLLAAGRDVIYDPALAACSISSDTVATALERYWRWNGGARVNATWRDYLRNFRYTLHLAVADLRARDPASAVISLMVPHYCYWKSRRQPAT